MTPHLLLIDNFDSFTYNLQHLLLEQDVSLTVCRNNDNFLEAVEKGEFHGAIIGPGPGSPEDCGLLWQQHHTHQNIRPARLSYFGRVPWHAGDLFLLWRRDWHFPISHARQD